MSLHAFVDESRRRRSYLLTAALVDPSDLDRLRRTLRSLLFPGQREVHFKKEKVNRRRLLVSRLVAAGVQVRVYTRECSAGEEAARQACLVHLVEDLVDNGGRRLVLDSRSGRDHHDEQTVRAVLGKRPRDTGLTYEHLDSSQEQLLWIADVIGWCYGAGGDWRRRVMPMIIRVVDLDRR